MSPPDIDAAGHHINILEFVAIIVNLWLIIVLSRSRSSPVGDHIFAVFADNTSALSWLHYASRSHCPNVCRLARFVSALLFASGFQGKVQGKHLAGLANRGAEMLSPSVGNTQRGLALRVDAPISRPVKRTACRASSFCF
jgi:hypothetical protein